MIKGIEDRLSLIEERLSLIEKHVGIKIVEVNPDSEEALGVQPLRPKMPTTPKAESPKSSSLFGSSNFLAIAAVLCFILASSFTIKLALDSGWLTPIRQLMLSLTLGAGLCVIGRFLSNFDNAYRSYLSAAGSVILFLSAYASSLFFAVVPQTLSIVGTLAAGGVTLALYHYHRSDIFAFVATVGTFLCPLFFKQSLGDTYLLSFYYLAWAGVFSRFSIVMESRTLSILASYLGVGVYAALNHTHKPVGLEEILIVLATLFAQFYIFAGGVFRYSTELRSPLSARETWFFFPLLCFFYAVTYSFVGLLGWELRDLLGSSLSRHLDSIFGLAFGGWVYFFYYRARERLSEIESLESGPMIQAFLGIALFHSGYLTLLPVGARTWLLPAALLLMYVARDRSLKLNTAARWVLTLISFLEFASLLKELLLEHRTGLNTLLSAASILILGALNYFKSGREGLSRVSLFLWAFHILALSLTYEVTSNTGSLAVTGAWGLYALLILGLGYSKKDAILAKSSLFILVAVTAKALLYDASRAPSVVRIACLLLTGAVLYGAGYLFRKMSAWNQS